MSLRLVDPPECDRCLGGLVVDRGAGGFVEARTCACIASCDTCKGSGWVPVGDDWRARRTACACRRHEAAAQRLNRARLPGRHAKSTFESFETPVALAPVASFVQSVARSWRRDGEGVGLVLHGPVGTGKTHLLVALARTLALHRGAEVRFVEFSHLLAELKAAFEGAGGGAAMLDALVGVDVLIVDELGKGRATEWELTIVDALVTRRYNAGKPLFASTNNDPVQARGAFQPLPDRVGESVYSRLCEMCRFVPVSAPDFRRRAR